MCVLRSDDNRQASILLDFGTELYGGEISAAIRGVKDPVKVRVRLGESVSEAMSDAIDNSRPGYSRPPTNTPLGISHWRFLGWAASRSAIQVSGLHGSTCSTRGRSSDKGCQGHCPLQGYPYLGSFKSSDERLNKIWETGLYRTPQHARLSVGRHKTRPSGMGGHMHPEVMTINTVFGDNDVVKKSLDFARKPLPCPDG